MSVESLSAACAGSHPAVNSDVSSVPRACPIGRDATTLRDNGTILVCDSIDHASLHGDWMMLGSHFS